MPDDGLGYLGWPAAAKRSGRLNVGTGRPRRDRRKNKAQRRARRTTRR